MSKSEEHSYLLVVSERGFGKRTELTTENYRRITRGGKGVHTLRCNEKTGKLVAAMNVKDGDELMLITKGGIIIRINSSDVSEQGRMTQGVTLINLEENDQVMDVARVMTKDNDEKNSRNAKDAAVVTEATENEQAAALQLKSDIDDSVEEARQLSMLLERADEDAKDRDE
jgi:hypothetical protein